MRRSLPLLLLGLLCLPSCLHGQNSAFDLVGPKIDVHVKRGDLTLPISQAANLMPGDRLWVHPDLPESQSTHFVLVVAFLRGATNPPPNDWFTRVETWTRQAREEGVFVTVPNEAQQALVFLAPETGGDFSTLRKAVRDRPGAFVRADQDLLAASWDRMRLEAYLSDVRATSLSDAKSLKEHAELASRSLGIKLDHQCFDKPADQQATCLTQHTEGMVLDDANAQSLVSQIANGSTADLMNQLSYSTIGGGGMYSPYIGAIVDGVRILSSLHTAHFQYIPALALPTKDTLNLRLNMPPSFRDPKSVVVVALPPVGPTKTPILHPINPSESLCAQKPGLVLAADGAPLVFGTSLAHDLDLHIDSPTKSLDIPITANAGKGGFVPADALPDLPPGELTATLRGKWGFDSWEGPHFKLQSAASQKWNVAPDDQSALIVGREDTLHIQGDNTVCVSQVDLQGAKPVPLKWSPAKQYTLAVAMPMKEATPGTLTIAIHQYGVPKADTLDVNAYAEAASLDRLTLNVGDKTATLKGTRLDEVAKASFGGITWTPANLTRVQDFDQLALQTSGKTSELEPGSPYVAHVELRDGRELKAPVRVEPPRPQVTLLNKGSQEIDVSTSASPVHMGSPDDLPISQRLVFFVKSVEPQKFPRNQSVEVAAEDGSFHTTLSLADGGLMLEDARTALGTVEPLTRFGASAFGPVRARAVSADGVPGDWMALGTLVRLPAFRELRCPHAASKPCILTGSNLFLIDSLAAAQDFDNAVEVPADFTGAQLAVPHPANGTLYLKLRDDPKTVQTLTLPVTPAGLPVANTAAAPAAVAPPAAATAAPSTAAATTAAAAPGASTTSTAQLPKSQSASDTAAPAKPDPPKHQ
jgi:hypothetical protein